MITFVGDLASEAQVFGALVTCFQALPNSFGHTNNVLPKLGMCISPFFCLRASSETKGAYSALVPRKPRRVREILALAAAFN